MVDFRSPKQMFTVPRPWPRTEAASEGLYMLSIVYNNLACATSSVVVWSTGLAETSPLL